MTVKQRKKPGPKGPTSPASQRGPFLIEDDVWAKVQTICKARGEKPSDVIRRALRHYVTNHRHVLRGDG